jgi:hypothetical protein
MQKHPPTAATRAFTAAMTSRSWSSKASTLRFADVPASMLCLRVCVCVFAYVCVFACVCMFVYFRASLSAGGNVEKCKAHDMYTHTHMHMQIHTHTCTH